MFNGHAKVVYTVNLLVDQNLISILRWKAFLAVELKILATLLDLRI